MKDLIPEIPLPPSNPATWDVLVSDCRVCVGKVHEVLHAAEGRGGPTSDVIERGYTAVLMTRLWRDIRINLMEHDLLPIPSDIAREHGLDLALMKKALDLDRERGCEGDALDGSCRCASMPNTAMRIVLPAFRQVLHHLAQKTESRWDEVREGIRHQPNDQIRMLRRLEIEGRATLRMLARADYDTLTRRPSPGLMNRSLTWLSALCVR